MTTSLFSRQDKSQLIKQGISIARANEQLQRFQNGFPPVEVVEPCGITAGIIRLSAKDQKNAQAKFKKEILKKKTVKFVPASGAASRMFQFLQDPKPEYDALKEKFLKNLPSFAFYPELATVMKKKGQDIVKLRKAGNLAPIVSALLEKDGLGYGHAPKGMILFHRSGKKARTPFEEHIGEALLFKNAQRKVQIHFTLPLDARSEVRRHLKSAGKLLKGCRVGLSDSVQSPATDCLAAEKNGAPVRDENGQLLLRPAGHGALLQNLNEIQADLIYVKNIDNILSQKKRGESDRWKKIIGGIFFETQERVFQAQRILESKKITPADAVRVLKLAQELGWKGSGRKSLADFFNRPMTLRSC